MIWFLLLIAALLGFILTWLSIELWNLRHPYAPEPPLQEADVEELTHPAGNVHVLPSEREER